MLFSITIRAMASELYPLPLSSLARRLVRELRAGGPVYGMARSAIWTPDPARDLSTTHFGQPMGTPLGPASGPHTQLAQNLVLCFLGGARFMELKTVQILDQLVIPRPCIHVPHVGYNVEWSQELRIGESLREYAKGWILCHLAARELGLSPDLVFDMSLGYDLAGIQSEPMHAFISSLLDAHELLDELLAELPPELRVEVPGQISRSVTLSTFHGCPADEIEAIAAHCLRAHGLHTIVKLNPTLLGLEGVQGLLHQRLGYTQIQLDPAAFEKDLRWEQLERMIPRLQELAGQQGVGLGVKFSNTLVCRSPDPPFGEGEMYLSGPPLHVLAISLAARFAAQFPGLPISFSAGVDAQNFPALVQTGISPVTTCTDLLKGKGYGRLCAYLRGLEARLAEQGHSGLEPFVDGRVQACADLALRDPRYSRAQNSVAPKKVGSELVLLDCLTCDKCIPVCPNAAIFAFDLPTRPLPGGRLSWREGLLHAEEGPPVEVKRRHQIGITVDACNRCGQCDPVCPEDGGPFATKPNLFLDPRAWDEHPDRDGFLFEGQALLWRRGGQQLRWDPSTRTLSLATGSLRLGEDDSPHCTGSGEISRADLHLLTLLTTALRTAWSTGD